MRWSWKGIVGAILVGLGLRTKAPVPIVPATPAPCTHDGTSRYRNSHEPVWRCARCGTPIEIPPFIEKVRGDWVDPIDLIVPIDEMEDPRDVHGL
jgi:hypothetical protein